MALTTVDQGLLGSNAQYTGFKNRIINGAMMIDQYNAGASITPSQGQFVIDRFKALLSQSSKFTTQQNAGSVTPPSGFKNYLGLTVGASANVTVGATDYFALWQRIEGLNIPDLGWGASGASPVTLSFWVRSSVSGTFGGALQNGDQTRFYPFTYTISATNTWEQKTITIAGDTTGTWLTTNGAGLTVSWGLGAGSNWSGTAGAWAGQSGSVYPLTATGATNWISTNSATFYITGVQLEKGSTATSFDYRPYGTELQLCQRYAYVVRGSDGSNPILTTGWWDAATAARLNAAFPVTMRATPSIGYSSLSNLNTLQVNASWNSVSAVTINSEASPYSCAFGATSTGGTTGQVTMLRVINNGYIGFFAEL